MLVQLRNTGSIKLDDEWQTEITNGKTLTMEELAAQAYVFYTAGFETTSSAMSFCLFEIAKNAEIQEKVHKEIDDVLAKYDGQLTYDAINELKYLDACLDGMLDNLISNANRFYFFRENVFASIALNQFYFLEALRKYCVVPTLNRVCTKEYRIPGTKIVLEKGTAIMIPAYSLQRGKLKLNFHKNDSNALFTVHIHAIYVFFFLVYVFIHERCEILSRAR